MPSHSMTLLEYSRAYIYQPCTQKIDPNRSHSTIVQLQPQQQQQSPTLPFRAPSEMSPCPFHAPSMPSPCPCTARLLQTTLFRLAPHPYAGFTVWGHWGACSLDKSLRQCCFILFVTPQAEARAGFARVGMGLCVLGV